MSFDGNDDYVEVPNRPSLNFGINDFSISAWVKDVERDAFQGSLTKKWYYNGIGWEMRFKTPSIAVQYYNGTWYTYVASSGISPSGWYHVVGVRRGTNLEIWVNGEIKGNVTIPSDLTVDTSAPLVIGTRGDKALSGTNRWFRGIIDEVRIYNRALSEEEIQALYQAKARLDYEDIRFTDSDGSTLLNYWQEADGRFWVKVPSIPANSQKTFMFIMEIQVLQA